MAEQRGVHDSDRLQRISALITAVGTVVGAILIPVVIARATFSFTESQNKLQQNLENQRANAELELERQRTESEALQSYLDQMSQLMLEKNLSESEVGSPVRMLARARTLAVLGGLDDSQRKWTVLRFLYQSELILYTKPVLGLASADLTEINFNVNLGTTANLPKVNFDHAYLRESQLKEANLAQAYLRHTKLAEAQLEGADLKGADLTKAEIGTTKGWKSVGKPLGDFGAADLSGADLSGATLTEAHLPKVDMSPLQ